MVESLTAGRAVTQGLQIRKKRYNVLEQSFKVDTESGCGWSGSLQILRWITKGTLIHSSVLYTRHELSFLIGHLIWSHLDS